MRSPTGSLVRSLVHPLGRSLDRSLAVVLPMMIMLLLTLMRMPWLVLLLILRQHATSTPRTRKTRTPCVQASLAKWDTLYADPEQAAPGSEPAAAPAAAGL